MSFSRSEKFLYRRILNKKSNLNVWFFFPGPESFALSSLGYMWLYKELDELEDLDVERVYSDSKKTKIMRDKIDLIAVSISFDMDFLKIFEFLELNKFPLLSSDRDEKCPLIYAGGPVITSNPAPYSKVFDFMIIGDGEDVNLEVCHLISKSKNEGKTKEEILSELCKVEGVYVPSISKNVIKRTKKLSNCIYTPILSDKAFFPETFILEIERGCANRCGFCLASYMNLPIRFPQYDKIIEAIDLGLSYTNKLALLGAQVTAHPRFFDICKYIENKIASGENIQMSISSLRIDSFKSEIVNILVKAGQKNLTLAIEAGSERLRKVVNKNISEDQIFEAIEVAGSCGLKGIKLYAMLGIPTETQDDIDAFVELAKKIKTKHKGFDLSFSFSTFVPKPNTPFQWYGRDNVQNLENKEKYLQKQLRKLGIQANFASPKWDYYQAVLSRGDENLTNYLIQVYKLGGKLGAFRKAAKDLKINTDFYAYENYSYNVKLPWDFIEISPNKDFLVSESKRLLN